MKEGGKRRPKTQLETSDSDRQDLGLGIVQVARLVGARVGTYVVVGEGVAAALDGGLVAHPRVVVGDGLLVVRLDVLALGLAGVLEEGAPVEGGRQAGADVELLLGDVGAAGEGAGAAAEDVLGRGLAEGDALAAVAAGEDEVVAVDAALDVAPVELGVDRELLAAVLFPDGVDVAAVVPVEQAGVQRRARVGAHGPQDLVALAHHQLLPAGTVRLALGLEAGDDLVEAVLGHPLDLAHLARLVLELQGDGEAHEVDVGDVDVDLLVIEGELAEAPVLGEVVVRLVAGVGLDEGRSRVEVKGQGLADAEPDPRTKDLGHGHRARLPGVPNVDGRVLLQWLQSVRGRGRSVGRAAVRAQNKKTIAIAAGDVSKQLPGGCILEDNVDSSHGGNIYTGNMFKK